jgi:hypothetical protein
LAASDLNNEFTFLGNPYASTVNLTDVLQSSSTNLDSSTFWVWDPNLGSFGAYVAVTNGLPTPSSSAVNEFLESGHSFFVQTLSDGPASLTFAEAFKATSNTNAVTLGVEEVQGVEFTLQSADGTQLLDAVAVNRWTNSRNVAKLMNPYENMVLNMEGKDYTLVNGVEANSLQQTYLNFSNLQAERYLLKATNFPSNMELIDNQLGVVISGNDLLDGYLFETNGLNSIEKRFQFAVDNSGDLYAENQLTISPNPAGSDDEVMIYGLNLDAETEYKISVRGITGQLLYSYEAKVNQAPIRVKMTENLLQGIYFVTFASKSKTKTLRLIKK